MLPSSAPLRVLHVIPALAPRYGGPSTAALGMCQALRDAGTETLIATTDADGDGRLLLRTGRVTSEVAGTPAIFFPRQVSESFKWSPGLASWLEAHVAEFDLVHIHAVFSHASLAAGRACRKNGVPYVVRPLGTLDPWSLDRHPRRKRLLLALGGRRLLSAAAAMHYTAPAEQRLAEERLPWLPAGVVVPLGVGAEFFAAVREPAAAPTVVSLGRLHAKKGLELLIDAWHSLKGRGDLGSWQLVIAGDGESAYVATLRRRAESGPACDQIEFAGWVDGRARVTLLRSASLFALPSHQENFGLALVEAMACGVPAVAAHGVNLAEAIEAAGAGWASATTVDALTRTLARVMTDPGDLARRGERARAFAERFRWPRIAESLNAMYTGLLQGVAAAPDRIAAAAAGRT